jgi:GNAT superfamily N-acetyltransferase
MSSRRSRGSGATEGSATDMDLDIHPTTVDAVTPSRRRHFGDLHFAPELFLELMVPGSNAYTLSMNGVESGHVLVTSDGCLIELALGRTLRRHEEEHFASICRELHLRHVRAYSCDGALVSLCLERGACVSVEGRLFRDFLPGQLTPLPTLRPATLKDVETLVPIRDGVFDEEAQVARWVEAGWVFVLEEADEFRGAGLRSPVWSDRLERDIGVLVHPEHRGKGYGSRILARLAQDCLREGLVPTAGCATDNLASRRALGRAGFTSHHALLSFRFAP